MSEEKRQPQAIDDFYEFTVSARCPDYHTDVRIAVDGYQVYRFKTKMRHTGDEVRSERFHFRAHEW